MKKLRMRSALVAVGLLVVTVLVSCAAPTWEADSSAVNPDMRVSGPQGPSDGEDAEGDSPATTTGVVEGDYSELTFADIPAERVVTVDELAAMLDDGTEFSLIDLRPVTAFRTGIIKGAVNIPAGRALALRADEVGRTQLAVLVAQGNDELAASRQLLIDAGVSEDAILVVDGGVDAWKASGRTLVDVDEHFQC